MHALRLAALLTALTLATTAADAQSRHRRGEPDPRTAPQGDQPLPQQEKQFPVGASWTVVSLNGKPFTGERPSFTLDQQFRLRGFAGCNNFSATAYPLRQQGFAVGPFALTKRTCDKAAMASEHAFLVALRTAAKWEPSGRGIVIKGQNGELLIERVL